jgi:hypothetical protein
VDDVEQPAAKTIVKNIVATDDRIRALVAMIAKS